MLLYHDHVVSGQKQFYKVFLKINLEFAEVRYKSVACLFPRNS